MVPIYFLRLFIAVGAFQISYMDIDLNIYMLATCSGLWGELTAYCLNIACNGGPVCSELPLEGATGRQNFMYAQIWGTVPEEWSSGHHGKYKKSIGRQCWIS